MTAEQLKFIAPAIKPANLEMYVPLLNQYMPLYGITTKARMTSFLSQTAHESAHFNCTLERDSGAAYDVGKLAERLGNTPEDDGDGERYKGRGLIQITGRRNYQAVSDALKINFILNPLLLEKPAPATESACWFWAKAKGLNFIADLPDTWVKPGPHKYSKFQWITIMINGGLNGYDDRLAIFNRANKIL